MPQADIQYVDLTSAVDVLEVNLPDGNVISIDGTGQVTICDEVVWDVEYSVNLVKKLEKAKKKSLA